jgi:hypothetical protein
MPIQVAIKNNQGHVTTLAASAMLLKSSEDLAVKDANKF